MDQIENLIPIKCTPGIWTEIVDGYISTEESTFTFANFKKREFSQKEKEDIKALYQTYSVGIFKVPSISKEEQTGNLLLAISSKAMCIRIHQVLQSIQNTLKVIKNLPNQDSLREELHYITILLQTGLPKKLRNDKPSSNIAVKELMYLLEIGIQNLSNAERKAFKSEAIEKLTS